MQICKYNMIRYEIIDRQRPGPQYQKKIIQITNFNQITETGLLYEKNSNHIFQTNYKLLSGKDLGHCMKKLMGKHTAEAFQPLCMYHADILYLCVNFESVPIYTWMDLLV